MIFDSWDNLARVLVLGITGYVGLVVLLRISGNRTLSKMNSFDLVVTIAFGSILASILINSSTTLAQGLVAIALLVCLQFCITWLSVRSGRINRLITTRPTLLVENGCFLRQALKSVRVTEDEIRAAIRQNGYGGVEQVAAVVLESDGSLSVIGADRQGSKSALTAVFRKD